VGDRGAGQLPLHPLGRAAPAAGPLPGTGSYVLLLVGHRHDDPLLLQVKQATASVLEPYAGRSRYRHPGHRVVNGQRLLQTASDIFLGWARDGASRYSIRQLWDMKGSINLETLDPADLVPYARLCGWVLARAQPAAATPSPTAATSASATASTARWRPYPAHRIPGERPPARGTPGWKG
jgi:hypothetical protein